MSGSLTDRDGENVPGIPGVCATRNFTFLARGPCDSAVRTWVVTLVITVATYVLIADVAMTSLVFVVQITFFSGQSSFLKKYPTRSRATSKINHWPQNDLVPGGQDLCDGGGRAAVLTAPVDGSGRQAVLGHHRVCVYQRLQPHPRWWISYHDDVMTRKRSPQPKWWLGNYWVNHHGACAQPMHYIDVT